MKKYSFINNILYSLKRMWSIGKKDTVFIFLRAPILILTPFLGVLLSQQVVAGISGGGNIEGVVMTALSILALTALCTCIGHLLEGNLQNFLLVHDFKYQDLFLIKSLSSDYENMESVSGKNKMSKAREHFGRDNSAARQLSYVFSSLTANIIGIVFYALILFTLNPWIMVIIAVTTVLGFFVLNSATRWKFKNKDNWKDYDRQLGYLNNNLQDFTRAKDIRLYSMSHWFQSLYLKSLGNRMDWAKKEMRYSLKCSGLMALLSVIREVIAYGLLIFIVYERGMSGADFIFYFGIIGGFAGWLNEIVQNFSKLTASHLGITELREFLEMPDKSNRGEGKPLPKGSFSIEFKNVSYTYEGGERPATDNISFKIEVGEKVAVVGINGAGKTTIVKLMCGLFRPESGRILIDGRDIDEYNIQEYFSVLSPVFQDIFLLPCTILENISGRSITETDREKAMECLKLAGLYDKISSLENREMSLLVKTANEGAIELSGGELQKLALARALYKNGGTLILDEPTAALDPIAENKIYEEYGRMTKGKSSLFISHRLASTRFCDKILFIENGKIIESGTHESLMEKGGKYAHMYEIQSHYYREGALANDL